jgi:hypothetical protein
MPKADIFNYFMILIVLFRWLYRVVHERCSFTAIVPILACSHFSCRLSFGLYPCPYRRNADQVRQPSLAAI